jgi:glycosyltransferase involved in cell wall biosynthesis
MRISVVTIARDELPHLEALAACVSGRFEHVLVDTGSSDGTPERAAELGMRVVGFPWVDDFSAARNHGIEQATGDWVLSLDADQRMVSTMGEIEAEAARLEAAGADAGLVWTEGSHWRETLFRRDFPRVRWVGRVHEVLSVRPAGKTSLRRVRLQSAAPRDPDRNIRLLLEEEPTARRDYYLGRENWEQGEWELGRHYLQRFLLRPEIAKNEKADARLRLAQCLWELQRGDEARESCALALVLDPHFSEAAIQMAIMSWPHNRAPWLAMADAADDRATLFRRELSRPPIQ